MTARAADPPSVTPAPEDDAVEEPAPSHAGFQLEPPSKLGFGLEGYAGIADQITGGENRAHGMVGALGRLRYHYFQLGATFEVTDSGTAASLGENQLEHWRAVGGFVGVILPYHHWVDFDGSVGVSSRSYGNGDAIYGERGLSLSMTALTFRFGVSDRMSHKPAGIRLGAALAVSADLSHANPEWSRQYTLVDGSTGETTGTTHIGGVSIGLVVSAGFEVGARPVRVP